MEGAPENSRFRRRPIGLRHCDPADVDSQLGKILEKLPAFFIIADDANRNRMCAEGVEIMDCIRAASRNHLRLAVIQNEDRSFARNARDFAVDKYISYEIAEDDNALTIESIDDFAKSIHATSPEMINSTASSKFSAM